MIHDLTTTPGFYGKQGVNVAFFSKCIKFSSGQTAGQSTLVQQGALCDLPPLSDVPGRPISGNDTSYQIAPVQVLKLREARCHFLLSSHHERPVSLLSGARPFLFSDVGSSCYYHRPKLVDVFAQNPWFSVRTLPERNVRRRCNDDLRWCSRVFPSIPRPFCAEVAGLKNPVLICYERGCVKPLRLQHPRGGL